MDTWSKWTEFFACGLLVLPGTLGIGFDSFEVFATCMGLMLLLLIAVTIGAPTVTFPAEADKQQDLSKGP